MNRDAILSSSVFIEENQRLAPNHAIGIGTDNVPARRGGETCSTIAVGSQSTTQISRDHIQLQISSPAKEAEKWCYSLITGPMQSIVLSVAKLFCPMNTPMRLVAILILSAGGFFSGCHTAHNVAVTGFRVIDAPAAYIRRHVDDSDTTTTTTTTTTADSDVVAPGRVINTAPSTAESRTLSQGRPRSTSNPPGRDSDIETVTAKPRPSPSASPRVTTSQLSSPVPTAKPVPGKAGYVFSPFDPNGGYVDVTGYKSGDKVKDPYSKKIFLVP
jgi:hypothetical protein